uniref:Uncharacterized protein n=1 Tax=viral metagenome TaxID=1070528 RepID=A0A6H1ZZX4_9ZZZZ
MAEETSKRDVNRITVSLGVTDDTDKDVTQLRVDSTSKRLLVDSLTEPQGYASVYAGSITVSTPGTAVQFETKSCERVYIQAHEQNNDAIVIGDASVMATYVGRLGLVLYPTQGQWFNVSNMNLLYADCVTDSARAHFISLN